MSEAAVVYELVDVGPNLRDRVFAADLSAVLHRSFAAGVRDLVLTSTDDRSLVQNLDIIMRYAPTRGSTTPRMRMTCGIHPNQATTFRACTIERMRSFCQAYPEQVAAIGECGLDYFRSPQTVVQQLLMFEEQIKLAIELQLPLFLHDRDSRGDMARVLSKYEGVLPPFMIHCFTSSEADLDAYLALGAYISVTGFVTMEKRGADLRTFIGKVPHDRLVLDSDAPYMSPDGAQSKIRHRNEPCLLPLLLPTLAECFQLSEERIAEMTTANARRFFGLSSQ